MASSVAFSMESTTPRAFFSMTLSPGKMARNISMSPKAASSSSSLKEEDVSSLTFVDCAAA